MGVFGRLGEDGYEQVLFCHDRRTGLQAIVAVHSTRLGPALGGARFHPYPSEDAALDDVLLLARAMTYKAAVSGLDLGGGKAVIIGDPATAKTEALLRTYARFVDSLGGRYVTAEDVGTTQADMDLIRRETRFVTGVSPELGGSGDPSEATAYGVIWAMKAVAAARWGDTSLEGRHVTISGVGKVGTHLVRALTVEERARVSVADVREEAVTWAASRFGATTVPVEEAHATSCDIFAPCALGGVLDVRTVGDLGCEAVVGSANNQLADASCAKLLDEAGVAYVPDYVASAGGLINIADELAPGGYHADRARAAVGRIFATTAAVLAAAETDGVTTVEAADRMAEARIDEVGHVRGIRGFAGRRRP